MFGFNSTDGSVSATNDNNNNNSNNNKKNNDNINTNKDSKKPKRNRRRRKATKKRSKIEPLAAVEPASKKQHDAPMTKRDLYFSLDCEMVGVGADCLDSAVGRVTIVNWENQVVLDNFVKVPVPVTDFRTHVSGITPADLQSDSALTMEEVREKVKDILRGKILIGHGLECDLRSIGLSHPWCDMRDTATYVPFMRGMLDPISGRPSFLPRKLRDVAWDVLKRQIQAEGEAHRPVEDAIAALDLYKAVRSEWETGLVEAMQRKEKQREIENHRLRMKWHMSAAAAAQQRPHPPPLQPVFHFVGGGPVLQAPQALCPTMGHYNVAPPHPQAMPAGCPPQMLQPQPRVLPVPQAQVQPQLRQTHPQFSVEPSPSEDSFSVPEQQTPPASSWFRLSRKPRQTSRLPRYVSMDDCDPQIPPVPQTMLPLPGDPVAQFPGNQPPGFLAPEVPDTQQEPPSLVSWFSFRRPKSPQQPAPALGSFDQEDASQDYEGQDLPQPSSTSWFRFRRAKSPPAQPIVPDLQATFDSQRSGEDDPDILRRRSSTDTTFPMNDEDWIQGFESLEQELRRIGI